MKISRNELKNMYGIALPVGKYRIKVDGGSYIINTVKDDTDGCILVGKNTKVGMVLESRQTYANLYPLLEATAKKGEKIWITIT